MSMFEPPYGGFPSVSMCSKCQSQYLTGTPHTCDHNDIDTSHRRLENWLGEWVIEPVE